MFNKAMISTNDAFVPVVVKNYPDWHNFKKIVDVGGGHGGVIKVWQSIYIIKGEAQQ